MLNGGGPNGEGSLLRTIARETGAELSMKKDRDPTVVLVTGQPGPVAAARSRLVNYLDGDDNGTVVLMEVGRLRALQFHSPKLTFSDTSAIRFILFLER